MVNRDLMGRTVGEYVLREPIGQGGGGLVYRSRQPTLNRDLVVKVLHERTHESWDGRERFLREAQLASRLQHHYATHIYAFGVEPDGLRWIAMEMVYGVTFGAWLRDHGPMSLEQFVPFFERVAEVVHAAHALGIVHRDLKPSNVMVIEDHARLLVPKLLDFGIAKAGVDVVAGAPERWPDGSLGENVQRPVAVAVAASASASASPTECITRTDLGAQNAGITPPGSAMGSVPYMSPEQQGDASSVGPAADIYSLGVLAYQALHGHLPPPPTPKSRGDLPVSGMLDRIFARALAYSPSDRQPTVMALAAEFRAALQASEREQLRASAHQWESGGHAPGLLWGLDMLARFDAWTRSTSWRALDPTELAFVAHSQRRARRSVWSRRLLLGLAVACVLGGLQLYTSMKTHLAEQQVTQLEVEQGRQALRDNAAEAKVHLANAYRRGDHSNGTTFMLARALQSDRAQLARLPADGGDMWSARFSPSGDTIVTTDDHAAQLWDARTYKLRFVLPHSDVVHDAIFSHDDKTLYTACNDGTVGVWDASTGVAVRRFGNTGRPRRYFRLALSPDERWIAAIDIVGASITVWDVHSGSVLATLPNVGRGFPAVEFTSDSSWLVSTGGSNVLVFDTQTWKNVRTISNATRFSVDPTASRVAIASGDGGAAIWDIPSDVAVQLRTGGNPLDQVSFSPDGKLLATIDQGQVQIWDGLTGQLQHRISMRASKARALELSARLHLLVATFVEGTAVLADISTGVVRSTFESSDGSLLAPHFSPDGKRLISAAREGASNVWRTDASYFRWSGKPEGAACHYDIPSDQRFQSLACPGVPTRIWDVQEGKLVAELPSIVDAHDDLISVLSAVSVSGSRAAIVRGQDVYLYELPGARLLRTIHHAADVNVIAFSPDSQELASGDLAGTILITRDQQDAVPLPRAHAGIDALAFLRDRIVVASADRQLSIYARASGGLVARQATLTRIGKLRFSSDGARMATIPTWPEGGHDPELWDLNIALRIGSLPSSRNALFSVWFPNNTHEVLTTSFDKTVRKWDADTGRLLQTYRGSASILADATSTADGKAIAALGLDGVLRFWDSDTGRQLWSLATLRSSVLELRRYRDDLITVAADGEISGWRLPSPDVVIKDALDVAVSCGDETKSSDPSTCRQP